MKADIFKIDVTAWKTANHILTPADIFKIDVTAWKTANHILTPLIKKKILRTFKESNVNDD